MEFALLDTALGRFAIAWTEAGICRLMLPGDSERAVRTCMAAAGGVERAAAPGGLDHRIAAYADGARDGFEDVPLDLSAVPPFHARVYAYLRVVGWGVTTTYGAIARHFGDVGLSRSVGAAMGANPIPLIIPCHRVLAATSAGGFSAPGGVAAKLRMLDLERASAPDGQMSLGL